LIETLRIENLAIVDRAELEFGAGLHVLTGETGAGKSIVLGALALLTGSRASSDAIRDGCDQAVVEAVFRTERLPELEAELEARGMPATDHELIVRRSLARSGRSRAWIGGQLVPVASLAELFRGRIEISSQHDSQSLLRREVHGLLLDRRGGLLALRESVADDHATLRALDDEIATLRTQTREREQRRDFLSFQLREIDDAALDPAELDGLHGERARLSHAGRLREETAAAAALLTGDSLGDATNAADLVAAAARRLEDLRGIDPELAERSSRLAALEAELRDAGHDLERSADGIEADPARLDAIEERLHQVERLQRKYGATVPEILGFHDEAARELAALDGADERESELVSEREATCDRLATSARELSKRRGRAARELSRVVQASLRELGLPEARFSVALEPAPVPEHAPCGPGGAELPEFRFSANAGETLRPLHKVASGGELSRAFLAIKGAQRESDTGMVLVFDEVDAALGGRAADRVGRCLAELGGHHQVLCITHLPQIAAFAQTHLRVAKRTVRGRTLAQVERVEGPARVEEIARMAGGEAVGEATLRHARELIASRSPE
jgi:DNA repair protein RecN (Recombination protein N)